MYLVSASKEVVIAGGRSNTEARSLLNIVNAEFRPFTSTVFFLENQKEQGRLKTVIPYLADYSPVNGQAAAYVCRNSACSYPVTDPRQLKDLLQ